jgi:branched-chain amino acid aminotransferase
LIIDIFPDARKSIDVFSNLKSANYLPYVMAAIWAKENKLNDALILNQHDRICDSTIANVFWVNDNKVFTPPLNEGCVAGVMRKKILELAMHKSDHLMQEHILTKEILLQADEVFLTNAIAGIRWVKEFRSKVYKNTISSKIFTTLDQTI